MMIHFHLLSNLLSRFSLFLVYFSKKKTFSSITLFKKFYWKTIGLCRVYWTLYVGNKRFFKQNFSKIYLLFIKCTPTHKYNLTYLLSLTLYLSINDYPIINNNDAWSFSSFHTWKLNQRLICCLIKNNEAIFHKLHIPISVAVVVSFFFLLFL